MPASRSSCPGSAARVPSMSAAATAFPFPARRATSSTRWPCGSARQPWAERPPKKENPAAAGFPVACDQQLLVGFLLPVAPVQINEEAHDRADKNDDEHHDPDRVHRLYGSVSALHLLGGGKRPARQQEQGQCGQKIPHGASHARS